MARYLLPCGCGRQLSVTATQAGEHLQCECGEQVEVPTLRHLTALERLADSAAPRKRVWGPRQGLVFLGAALIVIAAGGLVLLQLRRPAPIREVLREFHVEALSPGQVLAMWPELERGIKRELFPDEISRLAQNQYDIRVWREWRIMAFAVAGVGVLIVSIGLLFIPSTKRRRFVA